MTMILALLRQFYPYILAASVGFGAAWSVQGFRLTAEKQRFTEYKQEQTRLQQEAIDHANKQRDASAKAYADAQRKLQAEIDSHAVYRRCVASGRCGVRPDSGSTGIRVSPTVLPDASSQDAIFAPAGSAETLANECAETTLVLNMLQRDIEGQSGY